VQTSHTLEQLELLQYSKFQMAKASSANYGQMHAWRKWICYNCRLGSLLTPRL